MYRFSIIMLFLLSFTGVWAQQPKDTLQTEVINVVKPYSPSISDAFKIKSTPKVTTETIDKEEIDYTITSVPVASTFTPSKGKAQTVKRPKKEVLYDNFISVGFGNYTTPLLEAYVRSYPNRYAEFGALLKHHSSQKSDTKLLFSDSFYDSNLNLYYKNELRDLDWKIGFDLTHKQHNFYGLQDAIVFSDEYLDELDPMQSYINFALTGSIEYYDSFFKEVQMRLSKLSDRYNSSEMRFQAAPKLEFPISSELINFVFDIDYLAGTQARDYANANSISYTHFNIGLTPNFEVLRDNLHINLGAKLYASTGDGEGISLRAYPNVSASFQVIDEVVTLFSGVTGGLHQNSYLNMLDVNPYISPNFSSQQTDEKYRAYAGIKGKLASNVNYLLKGSYADERNKALHVLNPTKTDGSTSVEKVYELGNSFGVVYDNIKTLAFHGELNIDLSKDFSLGGSADYATYTTEFQEEAWNLPNLKVSLSADYHANKWTGTAKLFMMGERNDLAAIYSTIFMPPVSQKVSVDSYVDLNAKLSYAFTDRLSAFGTLNNMLGTRYDRYANYPVQGMQVLAGITYKFGR